MFYLIVPAHFLAYFMKRCNYGCQSQLNSYDFVIFNRQALIKLLGRDWWKKEYPWMSRRESKWLRKLGWCRIEWWVKKTLRGSANLEDEG